MMNQHIVRQQGAVSRLQREAQNGHRGAVVWLTGLSGAGKSTVANGVEAALFDMGVLSYVLDGDNVRHGLCRDLGFSEADRHENIRRIGEVAQLFADMGCVVLTAFISPFEADRQRARAVMTQGDFFEIYCHCELAICERRDVKGLYKKARAGEINAFTGISSPYEVPVAPDLQVETGAQTIESCVAAVLDLLRQRGVIKPI
jgi:adenylylsulfate kinase